MKKIYIAGPYKQKDRIIRLAEAVETFFPGQYEITFRWWSVTPHAFPTEASDRVSYELYEEQCAARDIQGVREADEVWAFIPLEGDWMGRGTWYELALAKAWGKPSFVVLAGEFERTQIIAGCIFITQVTRWSCFHEQLTTLTYSEVAAVFKRMSDQQARTTTPLVSVGDFLPEPALE